MRTPVNKREWSSREIKFIQSNFLKLTNQELADSIGVKLTSLRTKCLSMGLKRMDLEYWTVEQVAFLKANYQRKGDTELAEIFNSMWPKKKGWSKKHIEKKRRYLNLKRTIEQRNKIREGHRLRGVYVAGNIKMWRVRGVTVSGTIKFWENTTTGKFFPVIKVDADWIHWNRWIWIKTYGKIPDKMNIVFKDGDFTNLTIENLEMITNKELAIRNSIQRYPEDIKSSIYLNSRLNKKIKKLSKKLENEK